MSDGLFHVIEDAQVVLFSRGVYRQVKLYYRGDELFAAWGGGYVRLGASGGTSRPDVSYLHLDLPDSVTVRAGRLGVPRLSWIEAKRIDSARKNA